MKKMILILTAAIMLSACGQVDGDVLTPPTTEPNTSEQPANVDNGANREDVKGDGTDIDYSKNIQTYSEISADSNGDVSTDIRLWATRHEINAETDEGDETCSRGEVIFNAEVPADCEPQTVKLINYETGETVSEMRDIADFANYGDSLMGDGVYCCRYTFDLDFGTDPDVSEEMTCLFYAEFYDNNGTHISDTIEVMLYEPFSDKELEAMVEVDNAIDELLQSAEYKQMSDSEKFDAVFELLRGLADRGLIRAESIFSDGGMVTFEYAGGGHMAIEVVSHHDHDGLIQCN